MMTFDDFISKQLSFKHHALLLLSSSFTTRGLPSEEFEKIAAHFCGITFYKNAQVCVFDKAKEHPDVFIADRERKILRLEDIKPIRTFCVYPPQQSKKRLFLVENCERLNINAANSLLKVLEEPPTSCLFILTSSKLSLVLPTIASRTQKIQMSFEAQTDTNIESLFSAEHLMWLKEKIKRFKLENYLPHTSLAEKKKNSCKSSTLKDIISHCDAFAKEYEAEDIRALLITLISSEVKENKDFIHVAKFAFVTLSDWKNGQEYHLSTSLWLIRFFLLFI